VFSPPLTHCRQSREEEETASDGTDDALREEELVVFMRNGSHHYAEDMQKGADGDGDAGAVHVAEDAGYWALS
jgi:hypothetical protein